MALWLLYCQPSAAGLKSCPRQILATCSRATWLLQQHADIASSLSVLSMHCFFFARHRPSHITISIHNALFQDNKADQHHRCLRHLKLPQHHPPHPQALHRSLQLPQLWEIPLVRNGPQLLLQHQLSTILLTYYIFLTKLANRPTHACVYIGRTTLVRSY